ncbi:MAG: hypothetical protein A3I66_11390 [Burkholderiales bacterium RIFCSPLOWO2_02_FULL_57_36]|nr:MAG: hypothetical protein A3I66_11390 [Burkholderiales bacterium RIFCSPLOWO2_02_FULL_57_36]
MNVPAALSPDVNSSSSLLPPGNEILSRPIPNAAFRVAAEFNVPHAIQSLQSRRVLLGMFAQKQNNGPALPIF